MSESTVLPGSRHVFSSGNSPHISMETHAQNLVKAGFSILPLHYITDGVCSCEKKSCSSPGKHPLTPNGSKDATRDLEQIRGYWGNAQLANIGIATGNHTGVVVLDVDKKSGGLDSLSKLESQFESLSANRQAQSGGGGLHFYFKSPKEHALKNRTGILPGIDFRGEGGYIVAPPSIHASGCRYDWLNQHPINEMPPWLVNFVNSETKLAKVFLYANENSGTIKEARNCALTSIGGFLKSKGIGDSKITAILPLINSEACHPPLSHDEVAKISQSLGRYPVKIWNSIKPLPTGKSLATPLHQDHLPDPLKNWVVDICERMQIPLEFVAAPALVALSSIIGRKIAVKPMVHDDWIVIPNLWGLLVADPGSMKTAAINQALRPLNEMEKKARLEFETACQEEAINQKNLALEIESIKQSMKLDWSQGLGKQIEKKKDELKNLTFQEGKSTLREKRHKTNDPTIEKLALILKDNPQGILLLRDELSGWLESLAKSGREGSREFYLEAWNGNGSFSFDRIGRGCTYVESICISIFGGIQPERLKKYLDRYEDSHGHDGFVERFQIAVYPDPVEQWKMLDRKPDKKAFESVLKLFENLDSLTVSDTGPRILDFDPEAQNLFYNWREGLELRISDPNTESTKKSYLAKYRSLIPSLALIFQVIEEGIDVLKVSKVSLERAIEWSLILESHLEKIMGMGESSPLCGAKNLLEKIKEGEIWDGLKIRDIYRKSWKGLTTAEKTNQAITILEQHNYIQRVKESGLGGRSESILINPAIFEGGAQ